MNLYGKYDNFRESCLSAEGLSSRLRFSLQIIDNYLRSVTEVYLTEHDTRYHRFLAANYDFNITSSLFNSDHPLHQDMTGLTFADESFDLCISFEDLEHIPDYKKAIQELYRVTRKKGAALLSTPFWVDKQKTVTRARISDDGTVNHLLEPEYHGDPLRQEGILSFYDFGWDLLEDFKRAGFSETSLVLGYDTTKLILEQQLFILAIR
ncbi:methyltransferase domain-containing protein [Pedobacter yulinensis]|nr:methyltransferase domain-containing protein [Pedobacter yulinensis]